MKLFFVIGLGQFGRNVATTLHEGGADVVAIDRDEQRVDDIKDDVSQAVCMDATDISALRAIDAHKAQSAVVSLGEKDLEGSILATASLSDLGVGNIIVRASNDLHGKILRRVGATRLVYPEKQMGEHIANSLLMSGVIDQVTLSTGQTVAHIRPRRDLVGKTLKDVQFRARYAVNVISLQHQRAIVSDDGETQREMVLEDMPGPDEVIEEDDILIVVGNQAQIALIARKE